jgi:hypothetical protein
MYIPTAATGILAWRRALEAQYLQGILRLHLLLGGAMVFALWPTVWASFPAPGHKQKQVIPPRF